MNNLTASLLLAALASACGSDGPRWAKRADQIDRARWAAVCGTKHDVFDDGGPAVDVAYSQESFDRPSPAQPEPRVPLISCTFSRKLKGQTLLRATVHMVGPPDSVTGALGADLVSLLADIVPPSVHDTLGEVATATEIISRRSGGFYFKGGSRDPGLGDVEWQLEVSSRPIR